MEALFIIYEVINVHLDQMYMLLVLVVRSATNKTVRESALII